MNKNKYPIPKWIWGVSIGIHLVVLTFFMWGLPHKKSKKINLAQVQTHVFQLERAKPPPPKPTPVVKKQPPKKPAAKPVPIAKAKPAPTPVKKEEALKPTQKPASPQAPVEKKIIADLPKPNETGYQEQLMRILSSFLRMPHDGEAVIEVKVLESGKIVSIQVKRASDDEIMNTLKEQIANIRLPPFSHECKGQKEHTFNFRFI